MKKLFVLFLFVALFLMSVFTVNAQAAETLWIQTNTAALKTNETVIVTIHGISGTPIQGVTAQIRYDPSCLKPVNGTSPIPGMNGLAVPQESGLADVSFASTTPQMANGVLAEVRFTTLKGCQTSIAIETAALVVRNESGFATPLTGIRIDQNAIALNIDSAVGSPQPEISSASVLPLTPADSPTSKPLHWRVVVWPVLAGVLILCIVGLFKLLGTSGQASTIQN